MVGSHSSNFRVVTTNFLGVQIFRKFTVSEVHMKLPGEFPVTGASHPVCAETKLFLAVFEPQHDKTNKVSVRPAKTQISLGICPV